MKYITILATSFITLSLYSAYIDKEHLYSKEELQKNFIAASALMCSLKAEETFTLPSSFVTGPQLQRLTVILNDWFYDEITFNDAQTRINNDYNSKGLNDDPTLGAHPPAPKPNVATAVPTPAGMPTTAAKPPVALAAPSWHKHFNVVPKRPTKPASGPTPSAMPTKDYVEVPAAGGGKVFLKKLNIG